MIIVGKVAMPTTVEALEAPFFQAERWLPSLLHPSRTTELLLHECISWLAPIERRSY